MIRVHTILHTPSVRLAMLDHPPGDVHHDPAQEVSEHHSISFVESGSFDVRVRGELWRFLPGTIFVTERGFEFSCTHDVECPDDRCLSVSFGQQTVEDLLDAGIPALRSRVEWSAARQSFLRHRLGSCTPGDELRLELIAGALFQSLASGGTSRPVRDGLRVTDVMRRIDRAVQLIESSFARQLTLRELADAAGMSVYHFARVFREMTGLPAHRYLTAVRLRHAAERLDGGDSVTNTCYAVGFASLSHFVTAFRKRFGVAPSAVTRGARYPLLRASLTSPIWRSEKDRKNTQA
ncbi:MAG TPA: AraC family transcriptional regulator [Gemmatimonadaceae bacterium]|nr:AraC family transcriptional regulator [Gemmatimonadaceae bacterium]